MMRHRDAVIHFITHHMQPNGVYILPKPETKYLVLDNYVCDISIFAYNGIEGELLDYELEYYETRLEEEHVYFWQNQSIEQRPKGHGLFTLFVKAHQQEKK